MVFPHGIKPCPPGLQPGVRISYTRETYRMSNNRGCFLIMICLYHDVKIMSTNKCWSVIKDLNFFYLFHRQACNQSHSSRMAEGRGHDPQSYRTKRFSKPLLHLVTLPSLFHFIFLCFHLIIYSYILVSMRFL